MARQRRLVIPYCAHHLLHRGHHREPVFLSEADFRYYLDNLRSLKARFHCKVHAYCLMLNHVHLLVDPGAEPRNLGRLMKELARRQANYANGRYRRSGALWEGRYHSSPVMLDLLLPVARYIELNPVRTMLAKQPQDYPWSSCRQRLSDARRWIDLDRAYDALAHDPALRARRYREYLAGPIAAAEWHHIRRAMGEALRHDSLRDPVWDEHAAIAKAVARGDVTRAEALMREHSRIARQNMQVALRQPGGVDLPGVQLIRPN